MKIIKEGKENQVGCSSCGSVIEFEPGDVSRKGICRDDDGHEVYSYNVRCPKCHDTVGISPNSTIRVRINEIEENRKLADMDI